MCRHIETARAHTGSHRHMQILFAAAIMVSPTDMCAHECGFGFPSHLHVRPSAADSSHTAPALLAPPARLRPALSP